MHTVESTKHQDANFHSIRTQNPRTCLCNSTDGYIMYWCEWCSENAKFLLLMYTLSECTNKIVFG